ncbi:hypothetical protein AcV7_010332 [Taiwanofungus camphoratus]|nr:hypothetical protein AcV7_010332 [Antrodia cinnamomea]
MFVLPLLRLPARGLRSGGQRSQSFATSLRDQWADPRPAARWFCGIYERTCPSLSGAKSEPQVDTTGITFPLGGFAVRQMQAGVTDGGPAGSAHRCVQA